MRIPSIQARRDMEMAAELRAVGATWDTIGEQLVRQPTLLIRWTRVYREDWERYRHSAERRLARLTSDESRSVLRELLRNTSSRVRRMAADKFTRLRLEQKAKETPPDLHVEHLAYIAYLEEMSDEQLEQYLAEFVARTQVEGGQLAVVNPAGAAGTGCGSSEAAPQLQPGPPR